MILCYNMHKWSPNLCVCFPGDTGDPGLPGPPSIPPPQLRGVKGDRGNTGATGLPGFPGPRGTDTLPWPLSLILLSTENYRIQNTKCLVHCSILYQWWSKSCFGFV